MIKYVFREPLTIKAADKADAQKLGETLAKLTEQASGELTPKAVVDAARNNRSPLHKHFEWDDKVAAESFRIEQARAIIRCIRVEDDDAKEGHTPAFISVTDKGRTSYRTSSEVKSSERLQGIVLAAAERDLDAFERRYRDLVDVCAKVREARAIVASKRKGESRMGA